MKLKYKFDKALSCHRDSLRFKLAIIIFSMLFVLGIGTLYFNYSHDRDRYSEQTEKQFALVAGILKNDMTRWLTNRENDIVTMAVNPTVKQYLDEINLAMADYVETGKELENYWQEVIDQYGIYDEIYLITNTGKIILSTDTKRINTFRPQDDLIKKPLETGKLYFQDAYISYSTNKPCIAFSVPVGGHKTGTRLDSNKGVLVYRIDIGTVLKPLLESGINLGSTGEVILVNKNKLPITELRKLPDSALNYKLNYEPALQVTSGKEGVWRGAGYYGNETISVYRYIPNVQWGIIVTQDTSEIFSSLKTQILGVTVANILAIILVLVFLCFVLNRTVKSIIDMAGVARGISMGNFSERVKIETNDEIAVLGKTINSMAEELGQQFKLQSNRQEVLRTLVSTLSVEELLNIVLDKICSLFNFNVGAIFLVDSNKQVLERKALYCPGIQLLEQKEVIKLGEGLEGLAAIRNQVQVIKNMPEDTVYTVNWLGGSILPKCIVQVPLLFGEEILGVMSLATLNEISEQESEEFFVIGTLIAVAINNALSYKKAQNLSSLLQDLNEELVQQNEELSVQSEELQFQSEELQAQSEELQDITRELQIKNTELERTGRIKSEYLASLSHELRAPLNAVISFSDVLLDQVVGDLTPQQKKYLQEINISGQHLLNLINDLLDLSKIEAGKIVLNIKYIDPAVPLEDAIAMVGAEVSRKQLEIYNLINPNTYEVAADPDKLKQIFLNLLTNAVKFTPDGESITIGARSDNKDLYIWVADKGIGIAKEYHEIIFEEFKQGNNISGMIGGTGLGLAITKKLVNLQGGRIYVVSEEGQGATFTFTLPLGTDKKVSQDVKKCDIKCLDYANCPRNSAFYLPKPFNKAILLDLLENSKCRYFINKPNILVVDDDPSIRSYFSAVLIPKGYEILTAEGGEQGIKLALDKKPDIIILDIVMPQIDGFKVLDELSKHFWENGLSVFICTSKELTTEDKVFLESKVEEIYKRRNRILYVGE